MTPLNPGNTLEGFVVRRTADVPERNARLHLLEHERTGAQVLHVACADDNKVFGIGFRTPPGDSTGVAHILEHAVLAGSERYRTKEPFVDLLKTSLKTFLNAFTSADYTMYPIASRNFEDFKNLMTVYLDAVFFPLLRRETFEQEGWHDHCEDESAPLEVSGVVFNEMKGAYSSPFRHLYLALKAGLLPDTCYAFDSGGRPADIPNLTYEQFCEFHRTFYHPTNSFSVLYGDLDLRESLRILDSQFLSRFSRSPKEISVAPQAQFREPRALQRSYSIGASDSPEDKTYIALGWGLGTRPTREESTAHALLMRLLMDTEASPLKNALIASGYGKDTLALHLGGFLTPCVAVGMAESNPDKAEAVFALIERTLADIADKGFDPRLLESVLARYEFEQREMDFGGEPKGVVFGSEALEAWVLGKDPLDVFPWEASFRELQAAAMKGRLFENLIRDKLLSNPHQLRLVLVPEPGLAERLAAAETERLQQRKASMPHEELQQVIAGTRRLVEFQNREDSPEDVAALPQLELAAVKRMADDFSLEPVGPVNFIASDARGLVHMRISFGLDHLGEDEVGWAALLAETLTMLGTKGMPYVELAQEIGIATGGIGARVDALGRVGKPDDIGATFTISARFTREKCERALALLRALMLEADFDNLPRVRELIGMSYSQAKSSLLGDAFDAGRDRALGALSRRGRFNELAGGLDYFLFVKGLGSGDEGGVAASLRAVARRIFLRNNVVAFSFAAEPVERDAVAGTLASVTAALPEGRLTTGGKGIACSPRNSAIALPVQVQYVFMADSLMPHKPSAALMDLCAAILQLGHLWQEVRVKGGAYGARFQYDRATEELVLGSYRDPHLQRTLDVYRDIPRVLAGFSPSEREFESLKIGSFSTLDRPMSTSQRLATAHSRLLRGLTQAELQRQRDVLFGLTAADVRRSAELFEAFVRSAGIAVSGNAQTVEAARELFAKVENVAL